MRNFTLKSEQNKLYGVIHDIVDKGNPIILMVHGYFSSNKTGYNRFYYEAAKTLSDNNYITVRFDLSGMGESDGNLEEIYFENHVADVINIARFIHKNYKRKVILIGHSIGCLLSLQSYYDFPDLFEKLILISPLYFDDIVLSHFFDIDMIKELKETGHTCRKGIIVNYSFFNSSASLCKVAKQIENCRIPISLFFGDSDSYFGKREIATFQDAISIKPVILSNGDHNFTAKATRSDLLKEIISFLSSKDER